MSSTSTPRLHSNLPPPGVAPPETGASRTGLVSVGQAYFRAVRTHWQFAALFVAAVVISSIVLLSLRSATYEATAELLVSPVDPTDTSYAGLSVVQELGDPTRTIQTAAALVDSREIAEVAADELGDPWTVDGVKGAVAVTPQGQTNVLEIRASADDGEEAAAVANTYAEAVIHVRRLALEADVDDAAERVQAELVALGSGASPTRDALEQRAAELRLLRVSGDPTVTFAERAGVPSASTGISPPLVILVALAAALLLAPGAALLVERAGPPRVRDDDDVAEALAAPVLACVPGNRPGTRPVAPHRDGGGHNQEHAGQRAEYWGLAVRFEFAQPSPRTVMVVSPTRGDGRTSVVGHLALALTRSGRKVAVADLDAAKPDLTAALASGPVPVLRLRPDGMDDEPETYASPSQLVEDAARRYDHVLIDTPPLLDRDDLLRLTAEVEAVVVVARRDHTLRPSLEAVRELLATAGATPTGAVLVGVPRSRHWLWQ